MVYTTDETPKEVAEALGEIEEDDTVGVDVVDDTVGVVDDTVDAVDDTVDVVDNIVDVVDVEASDVRVD